MRRNESGYNQRSVTKWYIGVTGMTMRLGMNRVSTIISDERDKTKVHGKEEKKRQGKRERERDHHVCIEAARSSGLMEFSYGASHISQFPRGFVAIIVYRANCARFVLTMDRAASLNSESFISFPSPLIQSSG